MTFKLNPKYKPLGDQQNAINSLSSGICDGLRLQVLKGITGSGKTFTMASIIEKLNRPALVIAHNKTLAAQLCNEFREFFPENRVEYFVSYYDYYQPESYIPSTDTYIEKDLSINDEIDKLRHSATCSLYERKDTVVVASVSCIYGLGAPEEYYRLAVSVRQDAEISPDRLMRKLIGIQYKRNDMDLIRSSFRVKGGTLEIFPSNSAEKAVRIEFFGDTVERISEIEAVTGNVISRLSHAVFFPATHYAVESDMLKNCLKNIARDKEIEVQAMKDAGKLLEAQRLQQRVSYDIEMMSEMGYCTGIENYSRYFDGRKEGMPPFTLLDYFPKDFLIFIDESHMTIPQLNAMYNGDRSRKTNLVDYGFRLKAAYDNRPLKFAEFNQRLNQAVCVSATPGPYELKNADNIAEQVIRPTGLLEPQISVRKTEGQIDDLISEINKTTGKGGRVLVTTLTKKMAERLTDYLKENKIKVNYMHSEIDTLERIDILSSLRRGEIDVIVGINLLREGLDLPETQLVAILDADKEGFLRSETALIQTIGRVARNTEGRAIMYADVITNSMRRAIDETDRRRKLQTEYNAKHGIIPKTIIKEIKNSLEISKKIVFGENLKNSEIPDEIEKLKAMMHIASKNLDFETAIELREKIAILKRKLQINYRKK